MSFERYTKEVYNLAHEILDEFSEEDIEVIHSRLKHFGIKDWWNWKEENDELIKQFVSAPQSKRKNVKKYITEMPLVGYAAYQHCMAGYYFMHQAQIAHLSIGDSYREMAATSGNLFKEIVDHYDHEDWPWGGTDPLA